MSITRRLMVKGMGAIAGAFVSGFAFSSSDIKTMEVYYEEIQWKI